MKIPWNKSTALSNCCGSKRTYLPEFYFDEKRGLLKHF